MIVECTWRDEMLHCTKYLYQDKIDFPNRLELFKAPLVSSSSIENKQSTLKNKQK
ncbi:hypothetical protein DPMN_097015 [Dreissena polymorpha]|uniref:Uncharacterized protein n=1 Tax=Dreissena polymorpha TaxID=45954 RepID=A0A9D4R513_DREPO|nr:hypothetical protein DPMN_097015 [Dreissena polymorpha]